MRLNLRPSALLSMLMLLLAAAPSAVQSADKVASDRLLPPEVYAYIDVPNVAEMREGFQSSKFGKLLDDPAIADFKADVKELISEYSQKLEAEVGVDVKTLLDVPQGKFAFAIADAVGNLGAIALLDFGDNQETVNKVLESAHKNFEEKGAERTTESVDGTELIIFTMVKAKVVVEDDEFEEDSFEETEEAEPEKTTLCYFIRDEHFVVSSTVDLLKSVIERWDGQHESTLAEKEDFKYIVERCSEPGKTAISTWYINPLGLLQRGLQSAGPAGMQFQMYMGFLPALGLNDFKAVGGIGSVGDSYDDAISRTLVYVDQPTSGLLNLFQFPATRQSPPSWIPADTVQYVQANWDVAQGYSAVEELVDGFQGPGATAKLLDSLADQPNSLGIHPKKDIIDQLAGTIHMVGNTKETSVVLPGDDGGAESVPSSDTLVAFQLKDVAAMKAIVEKVAGSPGFPGQPREFQGHNFYEMQAPQQGLGAEPTALAFGVVFDHFIFTSDVNFLESVLRSSSAGDGLAATSDYQMLAEQFPEKTSMITFQRSAEQTATSYKMFQSGTFGRLLGIEKVDFTKLPDFEEIRQYFPVGAAYVVPDERGGMIVGYQKYTE